MSATLIDSTNALLGKFSNKENSQRKPVFSWGDLFMMIESVPGAVWTLISVTLTMAVYSRKLGWTLAAGLMGLLFIHECGHLVAASILRLPVSAPIFIPYVGAIIDIKEEIHNRWKLALMGIAGPIAGTAGALGCFAAYQLTGDITCASLAAGGCILNLFNLIPMGSLDGGHIVGAIARWIWIPGYLLMSWLAWHIHTPVILIILIVMLPQVLGVLRPDQRRCQNWLRPSIFQRTLLGGSYVCLVLLLLIMLSHIPMKRCFGSIPHSPHSSLTVAR